MLANFSGVEFLKIVRKFRKGKEDRCLVFTSSIKRQIRPFLSSVGPGSAVGEKAKNGMK